MDQTRIQNSRPGSLDTEGLCLLSLDGGGVRGLSSLIILREIMSRINKDRLNTIKPCDIFDLIGGTSTGGLIAVMLGRLKMTPEECIAAYKDLSVKVFSEMEHRFPLSWKGNVKPKFKSDNLKNCIIELLAQRGLPPDAPFHDKNDTSPGCKTFVCAASKDIQGTERLRSYIVPETESSHYTIVEAALATSAATGFFKPVQVGKRWFVDGALGANNPVDEVEEEATNLWCETTGDIKQLVKCFLSIGTGNLGAQPIDDRIDKIFQTLASIATQTEGTANRALARWRVNYNDKRFFLFNVEHGLEKVGLQEYKKEMVVETATTQYMDNTTQRSSVLDCVANLQQKQFFSTLDLLGKFAKLSLCSESTPPAARNTVKHPWVVPFKQNAKFTGRDAEIKIIRQYISNGQRQTTKIAITGLGGVGKTQLALHMAYQIHQEDKSCSVIWIAAISIENIKQAYYNAAKEFGIPGWNDENADAILLVRDHLSSESTGQWLLVFDNADDISMWTDKTVLGSSRLIDCLPRSRLGSIVFTTRNKEAAVTFAAPNVVTLSEMDEANSEVLLRNCLVDKKLLGDQEAAKKMLHQLAHLPLAIAQAAAYINNNSITLGEFLSLLDEQEEDVVDLLSADFEDQQRYDNTKNPVATTWLVSFKEIQLRNPVAIDYLSFMACVDAKDIPLSLLPPCVSLKEQTEALGTLQGYSFISRRSTGSEHSTINIHRLVHLATRNWLRKEGLLSEWMGKAMSRLTELLEHEKGMMWRLYMPHAHFLLKQNLHDVDSEKIIRLRNKYGMCLHSDGRYSEAEVELEKASDPRMTAIWQENTSILMAMANLSWVYQSRGRLDRAEKLAERALNAFMVKFGPEHTQTLSVMANLFSVYVSQGRLDESEKLGKQVLGVFETRFGLKDHRTLVTMDQLMWIYYCQGRLDEAEKLGEKAVNAFKANFGLQDHGTLAAMSSLVSVYLDQGRLKESETLGIQVIDAFGAEFGPDHPDTLASKVNLVLVYGRQGRLNEAEELGVQTTESLKRKLGPHHPNTLTSMDILMQIYRGQGQHKEAEKLEVELAMARRERNLD